MKDINGKAGEVEEDRQKSQSKEEKLTRLYGLYWIRSEQKKGI